VARSGAFGQGSRDGLYTHPRARRVQRRTPEEERAWHDVRQVVLERDNLTCFECGEPEIPRAELDVHHLIPRFAGGRDEPSNCMVLCDGCYAGRHPGQESESDRNKTRAANVLARGDRPRQSHDQLQTLRRPAGAARHAPCARRRADAQRRDRGNLPVRRPRSSAGPADGRPVGRFERRGQRLRCEGLARRAVPQITRHPDHLFRSLVCLRTTRPKLTTNPPTSTT
jgi:5-methylcytosine-specific restriction endonuclease McrA